MYILSDCYPVWNFNTSQHQTSVSLLHNTALSGYKNSLIEYMPICAKKWLPATNWFIAIKHTKKEGEITGVIAT